MTLQLLCSICRCLQPYALHQVCAICDHGRALCADPRQRCVQGRQEFSPTPQEMAQMLRNYYGEQAMFFPALAHM